MATRKLPAKRTPAKKRGRPPYEPSDTDRRLVETHAAFGTPHDDICMLIVNPTTGKPITGKTLRDKFAFELKVAEPRANARVTESLFYQAVGRPAQYDKDNRLVRAELAPAVAAAIWWSKARMGWKETSAHEHSGPNGAPIAAIVTLELPDLSKLTIDELAQLYRAKITKAA